MDTQIPSEKEIKNIVEVFGTTVFDYEEGDSKFGYNGILDVFGHCLSEAEAKILLSSFENHNLKNENKFFEFFRFLSADTDITINPIFVALRIGFDYPVKTKADKLRLKTILNGLNDESDKQSFLDMLKREYHSQNLLRVSNVESLELLVKLSTRELCFADFFIVNLETVILGNYELSFPLYCNDSNVFDYHKNIASKAGLFVR